MVYDPYGMEREGRKLIVPLNSIHYENRQDGLLIMNAVVIIIIQHHKEQQRDSPSKKLDKINNFL